MLKQLHPHLTLSVTSDGDIATFVDINTGHCSFTGIHRPNKDKV